MKEIWNVILECDGLSDAIYKNLFYNDEFFVRDDYNLKKKN